MSQFSNRRNFLKLLSLSSLGVMAYSYFRGIRFPPLVWEPPKTASAFDFNNVSIDGVNVIKVHRQLDESINIAFRAYTPKPKLTLVATTKTKLRLSLNNIALDAQLFFEPALGAQIKETIQGITRILEIKINGNVTVNLNWNLPTYEKYSFASIGDTGGAKELKWVIQRAHDLGAKFLLHLGDINYQAGDYSTAVDIFNHAPIPCYVSIGNHDFHDGGTQYQHFLNDIGPLNYQFNIGKIRYVNLDTAANTIPFDSGHRGELLQSLVTDKDNYTDTVAFTHRPLYDPQDNSDHDIGSPGERDWLVESLKKANISTLLSGHIHIFDRRSYDGIDNIIVGQGLGHQDLITNSNYSKIAIGNIDAEGQVKFEFAPLSMPMEMHCHPRTDIVKQSLINSDHADNIQSIISACKKI